MDKVMGEKKWYVIKTISGQELKVKDYIKREIKYQNLEDFIGQIIVPVEKVPHIRNGKRYLKEKVHLPGYVMIEAVLQGEVPHVIKNIPGVISFLSATKGGDPLPMRASEVDKLLGKADELATKLDASYNVQFRLDDNVKVIDGAFSGFNGVVEKIIEDKRKVEVMVLIFGRKTPLELNFNQVEKV